MKMIFYFFNIMSLKSYHYLVAFSLSLRDILWKVVEIAAGDELLKTLFSILGLSIFGFRINLLGIL